MVERKLFDPRLVDGSALHHEELAEEIVEFMAADRSMPDEDNVREGWISDKKIQVELENPLVQSGEKTNEDLANLADVFRRARENDSLKNSPSSRTLFLIDAFNVLRRVDPPDIENLEIMIELAMSEIEELPDDTRKMRLDSLLEYNMGIYFRDVDVNYGLSYKAQERSAKKSRRVGDSVGEAIARFCMAYDRVNQALRDGNEEKYRYYLKRLRLKARRIIDTFTDKTPPERNWKYYSVPVHTINSYFWSGMKPTPSTIRFYVGFLEELERVNPESFNLERHQEVIKSCIAVEYYFEGDIEAALELTTELVHAKESQAKVTAQLLAARMATSVEDNLSAKVFYEGIVDGDHNLEQVRQIAARELDGIEE